MPQKKRRLTESHSKVTGNVSQLRQHAGLGPVCYTAVADFNEELRQFGEVYVRAHARFHASYILTGVCACACVRV